MHTHPSWIEIDLGAIAHNTRTLKSFIGSTVKLNAVVKGNGYGHGAIEIAKTALAHGADMLSVAYVNEGIALREAGITAPILVLAYTPTHLVEHAIHHNLAFSISEMAVAQAASHAARALQTPAHIHLKIDTGMSRLGVPAQDAPTFLDELRTLPGVQLVGVFTHFSCADSDDDYTQHQFNIFERVRASALRHACNSAGTLNFPHAHLDMVRCGIALYGLTPFASGWGKLRTPLRPALTWKAQVALTKTLPIGTPVSYGNTFVCARETTIAIVPVGYADGFRRAPNHFGHVLIHGQRAPIVGRVCMDQCMVDVTDIPNTQTGDEIVLLGTQKNAAISAEEIAARVGTINYEITTALLGRVPRVYKN